MQRSHCSACLQAVEGTGGSGRPGVGCWRRACLEGGSGEGSVVVCSKSPASEVGGAAASGRVPQVPQAAQVLLCHTGTRDGLVRLPWLLCGAGSVLALPCALVVTGVFHAGSLSERVCLGLVLGSE